MRIFFGIICFLLTLFTLPTHQAFAASDKAYQDYLYQYDQYRLKLNNYKVARTEYLKYKTLLSETTALDTVKGMMMQRDKLLQAYLSLLNEKLNEHTGLSTVDKQLYQSMIQNEIAFLQGHAQLINSIGALTDSTAISKQLESHYLVHQSAVKQTIVALALGDLSKLNKQYQDTFITLRELANANRTFVTPEKQGIIDRWLLQINNKQNLYQQKIEQVMLLNGQLKGDSQQGMDEQFVNIQQYMNEAKQYLGEGTSFMQELINLIRYQD